MGVGKRGVENASTHSVGCSCRRRTRRGKLFPSPRCALRQRQTNPSLRNQRKVEPSLSQPSGGFLVSTSPHLFATHAHRRISTTCTIKVKANMGAPRGDHGVATSLADRERAICRVAGFGDFFKNARSGKPQNAECCRPLSENRARHPGELGPSFLG
jgi:hypothetical protein